VALEVAGKVVGIPTASVMNDTKRLGLRNAMATRLANPNPHNSQAQLYADMGFIDGLLSPPGDLRTFIRRQILLPHEVLDDYAQHALKWKAKSPLDYSMRILARYGLTTMRSLRGSEGVR
jgi:hypothetical protein